MGFAIGMVVGGAVGIFAFLLLDYISYEREQRAKNEAFEKLNKAKDRFEQII